MSKPPSGPQIVLRCEAPLQTLLLPFPHLNWSQRAPGSAEARFRQELEAWTTDFTLPTTVWLAGFFNPQSFLTAIMQSMARKNEWPLDKMCLSVEVTKKNREDMTAPPREGSYVYGLFMEGTEGSGLRKLPEPVPLGWRAETSWEGAGGRGARKGHVSWKLDSGGDGGASLRTRSDDGPETQPAAQGSQPGSAWPETAGTSLGVSTCFRAVRRNMALSEGLGAGSPGQTDG